MKSLRELRDTADRLAGQVLAMRSQLPRIRRGARPSAEPQSRAASGWKIEVVRDICAQPAAAAPLTFPRFMDLPVEIRLLIWRLASAAGRVVELQWSRQEMGFKNSAAPRPPGVLHACRESRDEALRVFQPYFGMGGRRKPIYVDPINDVLFFRLPPGHEMWHWVVDWMRIPNRSKREKAFREELKGIRRVAFLERDLENSSSPFSYRPLRLLPDLEELMVLWADWSMRTFEGRGINLIEGVSPCVSHTHTNISQQIRTVWQWEVQFGYSRRRPQNPVISLRHWCLREEE